MKKISLCRLACVLTALIVILAMMNLGVAASSTVRAIENRINERAQAGQEQTAQPTQPNAQLSPDDVVRIVLEALQHNDTPRPDSGIATTFRFSSPANQAATGPLARFIGIVKMPNYLPLLNHRSAEREPAQIRDRQARVLVTITDGSGERINYIFSLSKQEDVSCRDCWMTDGVSRVRVRRRPGDARRVA